MKYLPVNHVLRFHDVSIKRYGGSHGIRDQGLLDSALALSQQTMFGEEFYPTVFAKAGILLYSLVKNHPFVDGNKRTAIMAMGHFLYINGYELEIDPDSLYQFIVDIAESKIEKEAIPAWLEENCVPLE